MKIGAIIPYLGGCGGIRRFLELGNAFVKKGIGYTLYTKEMWDYPWFKCNFPIKDWSSIEADYILVGDCPCFVILPTVKGKIFIYVIAGGHFLEGYQAVYGKYPFILNNRVFSKHFPNSYLVEGGVNTEWFTPRKRKVLFYDSERTCKNSDFIREQLSGLDNIELIGLKDLDNERLREAYREGDYYISAESREGWGNMAAEALACGLTVVTNGVNCEPFRDRVIVVDNLRQFFSDPMKEFSWDRVADKLLQVFKDEG